jgi:hypothetical protein
MKRAPLSAFFLAASIASGAQASPFDVTVSGNYRDHQIVIESKTAPMDTDFFTARTGGRTVWSYNVKIGHKTHDAHLGNAIYAHATFVIRTTKAVDDTYTVNINAGRVHITSWYPHADQDASHQCHVYEDGTCNCLDAEWDICGNDPASTSIRMSFILAARLSRFAATHALQDEGVTVTNNP